MSVSPLILTRETNPPEATVQAISDGLDGYNAAFFPGGDWEPRYQVGRDGGEKIQSGVKYFVAFGWLFVNWLWVAQPYRKSGEGSRLMLAAEDEAKATGCIGAYLDTFSFQAPKFYAKLGYSEFGRLKDFPPGFDRIWLTKRFA